MKPANKRFFPTLTAVLIATIACRPVLTIGWQEIGVLSLILIVLLGPPLYRLFKKFDEFQNWKTKRDDQQPED